MENKNLIEEHRRDQSLQTRMNLLAMALESLNKGGRGEFTAKDVVSEAEVMLAFLRKGDGSSKIIS